MQRVAVVGSGPGGLVVSRYLKQEGFEPVIFDQNERIGGQWAATPGTSGVWPSMRTNTSRIMTSFSDLRHEPGTATYPSNQQMLAYLTRYATESDLLPHLQLGTRVEEITRDGDGWKVKTRKKDGAVNEEIFPKVVIASGRYSRPSIPAVPGLDTFSGKGGVSHTYEYRNLKWSADWKILIAGCGISALEIAGDLAMLGVSRVVSSSRKQRYVILKLIAGAPAEHVGLTRFGALAAETFPMEDVGRMFKDFVVSHCGSPEDYGARKPPANIFEAGVALSQHFLPLVAEGRIHVKPWITDVNGREVRFEDGTSEEFDAILFGTGFPLHLPFLGSDILAALDIEGHFADLFQFTFHPQLPGLAFVGMMELQGPYFPVLELQARWIAYTWSGVVPEVPAETMEEGIRRTRSMRDRSPMVPMNHAAVGFARLAGVEPSLDERPELARALLFGPLSPVSFRLSGKDSLPNATERAAEDARAFGAVPNPHLTPMQQMQLQGLAKAKGDPAFSRFAENLSAPK